MFGEPLTAADSWKSVSGNALFSFMTDGFWNFEKRTATGMGSTLKKRNTLVGIIHWHSFPHKLSSGRIVFNRNLIDFIKFTTYHKTANRISKRFG